MTDEQTITHNEFRHLLSWLHEDEAEAGVLYERIRQKLIRMFELRGCPEAETLADETIDRVTKKVTQLDGNFTGDPIRYFYGVANNVHLEWLRQQKRRSNLHPTALATALDEGREAELACLEDCLGKLPAVQRSLILDYYRDEKRKRIEARRKLADALSISIGALQVKVSRMRARLAGCVADCCSKK